MGNFNTGPITHEENERQLRELAKMAETVLQPLAPRLTEYTARLFIRLADGREIELHFPES